MNNRDLIIPPREVVREVAFEYKQEKLWEVFPEEALVIHASHFGTRSYLDSDRVDEAQVIQDGELVPGTTPQAVIGEYMSHEIKANTEEKPWIDLTTFSHVKVKDSLENSDTPPPIETVTLLAQAVDNPEAPKTTLTMFEEAHKNAGILKAGVTTDIVFKYSDNVSFFKSIQSPCDCATVYNDHINHILTVKYTPKAVPIHLKSQGYYTTIKAFEVLAVFNDGFESAHSFTFEAKVTR